MRHGLSLALCTALLCPACIAGGAASSTPEPPAPVAADAAQPGDAAAPTDPGAPATCERPAGGPGCTTEGCTMAPLALANCDDNGTAYDLFGADFCAARATLLLLVAPWCTTSQQQAPAIEQLAAARAGALRTVNVVTASANLGPPTRAACDAWRERYAITSRMTIDPAYTSQPYTPNGAYPVHVVFDRHGRIRLRQVGGVPDLAELAAVIDAVLAEP